MRKLTTFDRPSVKEFSDEFAKALKTLCEEAGVDLIKQTGSYSGNTLTIRATFNIEGAEKPEERDFARCCGRFGLDPEDLGKEFTTGRGNTFRITGINPKRRKYPISGTCTRTGKQYKFSAMQVQFALGK